LGHHLESTIGHLSIEPTRCRFSFNVGDRRGRRTIQSGPMCRNGAIVPNGFGDMSVLPSKASEELTSRIFQRPTTSSTAANGIVIRSSSAARVPREYCPPSIQAPAKQFEGLVRAVLPVFCRSPSNTNLLTESCCACAASGHAAARRSAQRTRVVAFDHPQRSPTLNYSSRRWCGE